MTFTTPPESPGEQYALSACLGALASTLVGLRIYAVSHNKTKFGADDWWIFIALFFTWATAIVNIVGAADGDEGRHSTLGPEGPILTPRYVVFLKTIYINQLTQVLAVGPTKISVLCFYRRIFTGKWFNIISWAMIALAASWTITFLFANLFECWPISQAWVSQVGGSGNPHCIDAIPMYLAQQYVDVIMDFIILLIPIPLIWALHMPTKRKLAVSSIFAVGLLTIGASVAKLVIMEFVGTELAVHPDISYYLTPIMYWPLIEASLGITAACMPKLPTLFVQGGLFNVMFSGVSRKLSTISFLSSRSKSSTGKSEFSDDTTSTTTADTSNLTKPRWGDNEFMGNNNTAYTADSDRPKEEDAPQPEVDVYDVLVQREYGTTMAEVSNEEKV